MLRGLGLVLIRRLALGAGVAALALAPVRGAAAAPSTPSSTSSFYVFGSFIDVCGPNASTECPLYNDAATEAIPASGGMTIVDFGAPCFSPATQAWGVQLLNSQNCTPDAVVVVLAQAWLRGYGANTDRSLGARPYVLVVGTSNSLTAAVPGNVLTHDQMAAHARAWFTSVIAPLAATAQSAPPPVTVWAGDDIEESRDGNWYDGPTTSAWVDAYASASGVTKPCTPTRSGLLANYGDYVPNEPGWSAAAVYHVSWQSPPACPVPEIYRAANASEWQSLNRYAVNAGLPPMQFVGVLSEDGALGGLLKSASWSALANATGQLPPYLSVIALSNRIPSEVPDPPSNVTAVPGPGFVMLAWSPPAWDGGVAVTGYVVTAYDGAAVAKRTRFAGWPAQESVMLTGLANGIAYRFNVSATNRVGAGPQSLPSNTVVPISPFPLR